VNRQQALKTYISGLAGTAVIVFAVCLYLQYQHPIRDVWILAEAVILIPIGWLCSSRKVYISESNEMLLGTIYQVAAVILLPLSLAVPVIGIAKLLSSVFPFAGKRQSLRAIVLNTSACILANAAAAFVFSALGGSRYLFATDVPLVARGLAALAALGLVSYALNDLAVSIAITLKSREKLRAALALSTGETFQPEISQMAIGAVLATLWHFSPLLSVFIVYPIYLSVHSFGNVVALRDQTETAIQQLVKSIDLRDTGTGVHSQNLEKAAERLALAVGLTPEHAKEVGLAGRAHDLGKIEISDSILLKRGPLTPEERVLMQEHPTIGANMLSAYSAFSKSVEFVKHHHERWDGRGYPDGLKGEDIPIGARIIAVVDSYDAMTADRPYRKSLGVAEAVSRLKADMGTQFDPRICATWIQLLIEDGTYVPLETAPHLHLVDEAKDAKSAVV